MRLVGKRILSLMIILSVSQFVNAQSYASMRLCEELLSGTTDGRWRIEIKRQAANARSGLGGAGSGGAARIYPPNTSYRGPFNEGSKIRPYLPDTRRAEFLKIRGENLVKALVNAQQSAPEAYLDYKMIFASALREYGGTSNLIIRNHIRPTVEREFLDFMADFIKSPNSKPEFRIDIVHELSFQLGIDNKVFEPFLDMLTFSELQLFYKTILSYPNSNDPRAVEARTPNDESGEYEINKWRERYIQFQLLVKMKIEKRLESNNWPEQVLLPSVSPRFIDKMVQTHDERAHRLEMINKIRDRKN